MLTIRFTAIAFSLALPASVPMQVGGQNPVVPADSSALRAARWSEDINTQLIASVGDGHTSLGSSFGALGFGRLPLNLYRFQDELFITDADTALRAQVGARVVSVGGLPIDTVIKRLTTIIPIDNPAALRASLPRYFVVPELLHSLGIVTDAHTVTGRILRQATFERRSQKHAAGSLIRFNEAGANDA